MQDMAPQVVIGSLPLDLLGYKKSLLVDCFGSAHNLDTQHEACCYFRRN
jgi:hypothetical protein